MLLVFGGILAAVVKLARHIDGKFRSISYVPPAREQIAALPANEILVRGCDQPSARPEELLRAARNGMDGRADELMRPTASVIR